MGYHKYLNLINLKNFTQKLGLIGVVCLVVLSSRLYAMTPFTCQNGQSFLLRDDNSQLYTVNLRTGVQTLLFNAVTLGDRDLSGLGYNPLDNYLYASVSGTNDIVRIGSDGAILTIDVPGLPAATFQAGDVSPAGILYLYTLSTTTIYKVNLVTLAVSTITLTVGANVQDISITPDGLNILGISAGNGNLARWAITGGALTATDVDGGATGISAASFMDNSGDLFIVENNGSVVYEVSGPTYPIVSSMTQLTGTGTTIINSDGARCIHSEATTNTPIYCQPELLYIVSQDEGYNGSNCNGMNGHSNLTTYNTVTGNTSTSGQLIRQFLNKTTVNALGFNPIDNYLWGHRWATNQLVRIGAGNVVDIFAIQNLPNQCPVGTQTDVENTFFGAADIDENGIMYLINGINGTQLFRVDLNPTSANYLQMLPIINLSPVSPGGGSIDALADIAINPVDQLLYVVTDINNLYRINTTTGVITTVGAVTGLSSSSGQNYAVQVFDNSGNLYVQRGGSDDLYMIANVAGGGLTAILYDNTSFNVVNGGDGAGCAYLPPLPVKLVSFVANIDRCQVQLVWKTASEVNADKFYIEHSNDGRSYVRIGSLPALGNISSTTSYRYDLTMQSGTSNYYRLAMVDMDGSVEYSPVISQMCQTGITIEVYPNPASAAVGVNVKGLKQGMIVELFEATGKKVLTQIVNMDILLLKTGSLAKGTYFVHVTQDGRLVNITKLSLH